MKLKKFYADNMQEALKTIKDEIGPDAVILSSKLVRSGKGLKGLFSKKVLEVLAGFEEKPVKEKERYQIQQIPMQIHNPNPPKKPQNSFTVPNMEQTGLFMPQQQKEQQPQVNYALNESIDELRALINKFEDTAIKQSYKPETQFSKEVMGLYANLIEQDVEQSLAQELCAKADQIAESKDAAPKEVLRSLIEDMLGKPQSIEHTKFKQKVVMLTGPTGVGKTTTLVKLASQFVVKEGLDVGIINADVFRVAAQEHLQAYCEILNSDMITIYEPEEITDALTAFRSKDIIFLDTAGKVADDEGYQNEIRKLVKLGNIDDIYLTLSASTSQKVLKAILSNYAFLKTHSVIVTKVDEVPTKGVVLNIAEMSGRPLSYMTIGQSVPDDITEVVPEQIAQTLLENQEK